MKITFYDIFRYLRQVLDGDHQSTTTLFVTAFILQRLQNYTSRFPESMSYRMDVADNVVDLFIVRDFVKSYIDNKCGKFCPESLLLCMHFMNAYILALFGENLLESPSLDVKNN